MPNMSYETSKIIDDFNNTHDIKDVIEKCTGITIKGKSLECPLHTRNHTHKGHNASIDIAKNMFSCWTQKCLTGARPWTFIEKYNNLSDLDNTTRFKETAKIVNELFGTNIPIFEKGTHKHKKKSFVKPTVEYNSVFENDGTYITEEVQNQIEDMLRQYRHIVLNANTGMGKTYMTTEMCKKLSKELNLDYVLFIVPTRALVENVNASYPDYKKFYGDDIHLGGQFIVMTYNKANLVNTKIVDETMYKAIANEMYGENNDVNTRYMVVMDEAHELLSKRNMFGITLIKSIETLIKNADYSICMSASTNDFIKAYKDSKLYNHTVKITPKQINYTLDNLYIYRCSGKQEIRIEQITNKMKEHLKTKDYIFMYVDNKKQLEQFSKVLDEYKIDNIPIYSDNKTDEEVKEEYLSIVNDSKLKKTVVLCTSVINAGVNILNKNVLTIVYQNKTTFDTNKIEQFLGRLRTTGNNDAIVFLNQIPNENIESNVETNNNNIKIDKVIGSIKSQFEYNNAIAAIRCRQLNEAWLDYCDTETIFSCFFEMVKGNEEYKEFEPYYYIDGNILKLDEVGIYERSRLQWLRLNYYNDAFIKEMLKDVKAKNKHDVVTIISNKKIDVDIKIEKKEVIPLEQYLLEIKNDKDAQNELFQYADKKITNKKLTNEIVIDFYNAHKKNSSRYTLFMKSLRTCFAALDSPKFKLSYLKPQLFIEFIDIFLKVDDKGEPLSNEAIKAEIKTLKRTLIYNNMYPLGHDINEIRTLGDIKYYYIRQLDKLCKSRHKPSNKQLKSMLNSIFIAKGHIYVLDTETFEEAKYRHTEAMKQQTSVDILKNNVGGKWHDSKGKEIDPQLQLEVLSDTIKQIYYCSNSLKLYSLN